MFSKATVTLCNVLNNSKQKHIRYVIFLSHTVLAKIYFAENKIHLLHRGEHRSMYQCESDWVNDQLDSRLLDIKGVLTAVFADHGVREIHSRLATSAKGYGFITAAQKKNKEFG